MLCQLALDSKMEQYMTSRITWDKSKLDKTFHNFIVDAICKIPIPRQENEDVIH